VTSHVTELEKIWELSRRIDSFPVSATLRARLLEPAADFLRAKTAVARVFSVSRPVSQLESVDSLEISDSVHDAYLNRYFQFDPAHHVLNRRLSQPLFADPDRPGEWALGRSEVARGERLSSACSVSASQRRRSFRRYFKEFLAPNDLYHHLGFCYQDASTRLTFLLDFHREQCSSPFSELDMARAKVLAALLHAKPARIASATEPHASLSARENEVAQAVTSGMTNKEVGAVLGISVRTVENHLRSIFAKLGIKTRICLAARLREGNQGIASS
jgi:DNA-binding CsgD family transcriptional regulator